MILEAALLNIKKEVNEAFENAFRQASPIIASMPGYIRHELHHCLEDPGRYLLLVQWEKLEDHTVGFRQSPLYEQWKRSLHHFYDPFPLVEHFEQIDLSQR